jgi:hypothetical protein
MWPLLTCFAWSACLLGIDPAIELGSSYLLTEAPAGATVEVHSEPFVPHEGDIVLFDENSPTWNFLYKMVGSGPPDHSGIVVRLPDGRPALLESGPDDGKLAGLRVCLIEAVPRLHEFLARFPQGRLYIRRVCCPLTPDQSAHLTEFALAQAGKHYAVGRLLLRATPARCRSGLRAKLFGKTYLDRSAWLCSELVVAAGTAAGLFDPHIHHANRIYPLDMLQDTTYDLSATWYKAGMWVPNCPERQPRPRERRVPMS